MTIDLDEIYSLSYLARDLEPDQYNPPSICKQPYIVQAGNHLNSDVISEIIDKFNHNNFVIIKNDSANIPEHLLENLSEVFGEMIEQTPVKGSTQYDIESTRSNSTSTKNNTYQPLHSDGNFKPNPPKIIALQCLRNSKLGGYTKLVYARNIYKCVEEVAPTILELLFEEGVIKFYRKDRYADDGRVVEYTKPIFYRLPMNRIGISFNPMMAKIVSTSEIEDLYRLISNFVSQPINQLTFQLETGETLVGDNFSLLHARTAFPTDGGRLLRRAWYNGEKHNLSLGFCP